MESNIDVMYTKILEVNLFAFAFAYRLFHEDFSLIIGGFCILIDVMYVLSTEFLSPQVRHHVDYNVCVICCLIV